jgi:hypothetical protein
MHLCEWGLGDPCAVEGRRGFTALDGGGDCKEQNGIGTGMPDLAVIVAAGKAWLCSALGLFLSGGALWMAGHGMAR